MTALAVTGQLIDNKTIDAAMELDQRIRECLRDYVQLGKLLMEMRDNQAYRLVGPYDTFEDYCKDVEGLAYRVAQRKILSYLVHRAIEENLGSTLVPPSLEHQVKQLYLHEGAIARFKTEKRTVKTRDGLERAVEVPVAVANPKKVADQWAAIVKAHEEKVERSQRVHQERVEAAREAGEPEPVYRRPKLTGNFVVNELPYQYQPARKTSGEAHYFVRWMSKIMTGIDAWVKLFDDETGRWDRLVANPDRKRLTPDVIKMMLDDIDETMEVLQKVKKEIKDEFCK